MKDYKDTLNLPKTDFPMRANLPQREPALIRYWQDINLYEQRCAQGKNRDKFILHDGPPYANGKIHMGTGLNKILKDIVIKSKVLSKYDSPYVPGWDCHGLPIEINVEKKIGKAGDKVTKEEFIKACRNYASEQMNIQCEGFKRLGVVGDWNNPYLTMDFKYEANVVRALAKIYASGHIAHGKKPVHWCTACGSALAEAEVEYKDKSTPAIDVRFKVINKNEFTKRLGISLKNDADIVVPIWTTTPWTLPANQAVALNAKLEYSLVKTANEYFLIAKDLLNSVMQRYEISNYSVVATCLGEKLENILLQHPFLDRKVPIILGEHVTIEAGTGAVHTAPGHGLEDYMVATRYNLPIENPIDDKGCFLPNTQFFAGKYVFKANDHIIKILQENGNLIHLETIQHSYPHCWRHKTPLIFRATPQWFISMDKNKLREKTLTEIEKINWFPSWGKTRIKKMVEQRPDWCISRQRICGTPITFFVHKQTGELHPKTFELMEQVAELIEQHGVEIWLKLNMKKLLGDEADQYQKITDTLDVWFDAGVTHSCVLMQRKELHMPAELYLEGSDQHRGWFQSALLTAVAMYGHAPCKTILTHGHVLDAEGHKMSKSLGNVIDPEKLSNDIGADILRLWGASSDYSGDIPCSSESLKRASDVYRRLRNTAKFLLSNLHDFDIAKHAIPTNKMLALDRWAIDSARILQQEIKRAYDEYQFLNICQKIHNFCSIEMGSFYLDIIKDRLYTSQADKLPRRSAQTALYHILQALVRWLTPIISFTAEEIWQHMKEKTVKSALLTVWYENLAPLTKDEPMNQAYWHELMLIRDAINKELEKQRNAGKIGSALDADVILYCDNALLKKLQLLGDELRFIFITSSAKVLPISKHDKDSITTETEGLLLKIVSSPHKKCIRCWHHREDVGTNSDHPELCSRCAENVVGNGEQRLYA